MSTGHSVLKPVSKESDVETKSSIFPNTRLTTPLGGMTHVFTVGSNAELVSSSVMRTGYPLHSPVSPTLLLRPLHHLVMDVTFNSVTHYGIGLLFMSCPVISQIRHIPV